MNDKRLEADINDAASQAINLIEELEAEIEDLKGQLRGWQEEVDEKDSEIEELKEEIELLRGEDSSNIRMVERQGPVKSFIDGKKREQLKEEYSTY